MKPQTNGNYFFDPNSFTENATDNSAPPCSQALCSDAMTDRCSEAWATLPARSAAGRISATRILPILKTITLSETKHIDFRAEFFNIFNHTQFFTPDGNTSDGSQFGQVTQARDPRLVQFALKFFF